MSKQYQVVNSRVKLEQILNQQNITHPKSKELIGTILIYICEQRELHRQFKNVDYYDAKALRNNIIDLSKEGPIYSRVFNTLSAVKEKNRAYKKAIEDLISEYVIYPLKKEGDYILSPLFYFDGLGFLNVYLYWCYFSGALIENKYVEDCVKDEDGFVKLDIDELNSMVSKGILKY